jgi:protein O-GlcNAc transferase
MDTRITALQAAVAEAFQLGDDTRALRAMAELAEVVDDRPSAYAQIGEWLRERGRMQDAEAWYVKAIAIAPEQAALHNNLAAVLMDLARYEDAIPVLETTVRLDPSLAIAHSNLATCHYFRRRLPEAREAYRAAAVADPQFIYPRVQALAVSRESCEWQGWEQDVEALSTLTPSPSNTASQMDLLFLPLPPDQLRAHAESYGRSTGEPALWVQSPRRATPPRISIGYVSDELRDHVVGSLLVEMLELHDKRAFDIHVFDWGQPSNTSIEKRVGRSGVLRHDVSRLNEQQIAQRIASFGIDVLVDLKGYTTGNRIDIFRQRPAPIQVNWLGYPGTLGQRCFDYLIADPFVIPRGEEGGYTEAVLRLPSVFLPTDRQRPMVDSRTRAEYGLPDDAVVFCYLGRSSKIGPEVFADWLDILAAVPSSVLWLRADNELARANLRKHAATRGLAERLIFFRDAPGLSTAHLIARYKVADLALDTYPYGSHATANEALWAGCPLVTRAGPAFASRVAGSLLNALGLSSLVTSSREEFRRVAIELGSAPERLAAVRTQLASARDTSAAFDSRKFTRDLERAYAAIVRRQCEGLAPASMDVDA